MLDGMKKPKSPCTANCPDRSPHCHGAECPHGWLEYEEQKREYFTERGAIVRYLPRQRYLTDAAKKNRARLLKRLREKGR